MIKGTTAQISFIKPSNQCCIQSLSTCRYMYCWFWSTACCGEYLTMYITSARCQRRPPQPGRCLFQFHVTGRDIFRVVEKLKSAWWASHAQSLMEAFCDGSGTTEAGRMRKVGSTSTFIVHHTIIQYNNNVMKRPGFFWCVVWKESHRSGCAHTYWVAIPPCRAFRGASFCIFLGSHLVFPGLKVCECATFKFLSPSLSERPPGPALAHCSYSITEIVMLISFCYYFFSFRASLHRCMYPSSYINLSSPLWIRLLISLHWLVSHRDSSKIKSIVHWTRH